jgi:hypothetical protein
MVIYVDAGVVRADYFDSENHVIRYVAEARPGEVVFVSETKILRTARSPELHARFSDDAQSELRDCSPWTTGRLHPIPDLVAQKVR